MEPKYKFRLGVLGLIGLGFVPFGLLFLIIGTVVPTESIQGSATGFRIAFCGVGALFLVLGCIFLALTFKTNSRIKKLIEAGNYIMADFLRADLVTNVEINGRNPYKALFQFTDPIGMVHIFSSRSMMTDPTPSMSGRQVRVYVDPDNYDNYYADTDSIFQVH